MGLLRVFLLGRVDVSEGAGEPHNIPARKAQELLAQLLLSKHGYVAREVLADRLWPEHEGTRGRKYLRQTIWQLQASLDEASGGAGAEVLRIEPDWISLSPDAPMWTDVGAIEDAFSLASGDGGLDDATRPQVEQAVDLYRGEYLAGVYEGWAVFERERVRANYLRLLDSLVAECERREQYEQGIAYASRALRWEPADERMYRHLMTMMYRSGDRTGALRQYLRCAEVLRDELDVEPSEATRLLLAEIRRDSGPRCNTSDGDGAAPVVLGDLLEIRSTLREVARTLDRDISSMIRRG